MLKRKPFFDTQQLLPIFPPEVLAIFSVFVVLALASANPLLTFYALIVIPIYIKLLWRKGEPPVFVFVISFQWLQASVKIFHADFYGMPMSEFQFYEGTVAATWASLTGIILLSVGIRLALTTFPIITTKQIKHELDEIQFGRLLLVYFGVFVVVLALDRVKFIIPQLSQIIVAVVQIKWAIFFLLGVKALAGNAKRIVVAAIFIVEIVVGFSGYFSSFKEVFFYFFITYLTVKYHIRARAIIFLSFAAAVLLVLAVFWSAIKDDYRSFVRNGSVGQVVNVDSDERFDRLIEMATNFTDKHFDLGFDALLRRIAYVDFFGAAIDYVPAYVPHENGAVWGGALAHIFMPRLLFPNKPRLSSDSEHTMKYTGIFMASDAEGVSISIGYMGDSYIDFGIPGMFIPIILLGILWGTLYRTIIHRAKHKILGMGGAVIILMPIYQFEMAIVKMLGTVVMNFLVIAFLIFLFEQRFYRLLIPSDEQAGLFGTRKNKKKQTLHRKAEKQIEESLDLRK